MQPTSPTGIVRQCSFGRCVGCLLIRLRPYVFSLLIPPCAFPQKGVWLCPDLPCLLFKVCFSCLRAPAPPNPRCSLPLISPAPLTCLCS